jgi:hypothetical protein
MNDNERCDVCDGDGGGHGLANVLGFGRMPDGREIDTLCMDCAIELIVAGPVEAEPPEQSLAT